MYENEGEKKFIIKNVEKIFLKVESAGSFTQATITPEILETWKKYEFIYVKKEYALKCTKWLVM